MKEIIMIMILALGANITYAQGGIGSTKVDGLATASEYGQIVKEGVDSDGEYNISISDRKERFMKIYYFSEDKSYINFSLLVPYTDEMFTEMVTSFNADYIIMDGDTWHSYFDSGVIIINMLILSDEFRKDGIKYYPYFSFSYKIY